MAEAFVGLRDVLPYALAAWQERLPAGAARFTSPVPHPGWIPPEDWAEYLRRGE